MEETVAVVTPSSPNSPVTSIIDYLEKVQAHYQDKELLWFRGQGKDYEKLQPKLLRNVNGIDLEESIFYRFQSQAIPLLDSIPNSYFEWLFVMQHFGLPTRLLDWSTDALIALSFAVMNRREGQDYNAVVYCLEPYKLNNEFRVNYEKPERFLPNIIMSEVETIFGLKGTKHYRFPLACVGPLNNIRIVAQKGAFTIFPARKNEDISLKHLSNLGDFITSIEIDKASIPQIQNELRKLGITQNSIYPSLENLSSMISQEFNL